MGRTMPSAEWPIVPLPISVCYKSAVSRMHGQHKQAIIEVDNSRFGDTLMNITLEAHQLSADAFPTAGTSQEKFRFLLPYAILAPSNHNSQPWRFRLGADYVEMYADRSRALPVVDPMGRELIISCGAALGHLTIALRRFGYAGEVQIFPDPDDRDLLARIWLGDSHLPDADDERLFQSLFARHTNRKPFHAERIPAEILAKLEASVVSPPVWLKFVPEGDTRHTLAQLIAHADRDQLADTRFRHELVEWIRPHADSYALSKDGIPGDLLGMPGLIADVGPFLVRTFDTGALFSARDRQLAINSPLLVVLGTTEDTPPAWLQSGKALSDLLLNATSEGIVASYLNAPIEVPELRAQVCEAIGESGYPQLILRMGYSDSTGPTPRRPLAEVLES